MANPASAGASQSEQESDFLAGELPRDGELKGLNFVDERCT